MNESIRDTRGPWMYLAWAVFMTGCAGTRGSISTVSAPTDTAKVVSHNELVVHVTVKDGATEQPKLIGEEAAERIKNHITNAIKTEAPGRFKEINPVTPGTAALRSEVVITNYDAGNAFARFMLAGLGQMHIDSEVTLSDSVSNAPLAKYEVTKTFAWGGIYGGSKKITDIEQAFAEAVAEAILRKSQ